MGGDTISVPESSIDDEFLSIVNQQFLDRSSEIPTPWPGGFSGKTAEENDSMFGESDAGSFQDSYNTLEIKGNERRKRNFYEQVLKSYDELKNRVVNMEVAKTKILSYTPGSWVGNIGGMTMSDYDLPKTTTLLLIGPESSGKSSLINRISRVLEDDKFAPERAQVTYHSSYGNGTSFLQEYMIPRNSTSFCLYDTPSFSHNSSGNSNMIKQWMTKGVSHNESMKRWKYETDQDQPVSYERRRVNFVIFVVNALSILKCMESSGADTRYIVLVSQAFSSPFLSFKDHKPTIVITHGDLLSLSERARVRVHLGKLLGVHPSKQIFDIPDDNEITTELTIVDMLRYSLEHADRNLVCKSRPLVRKTRVLSNDILIPICLVLLLAVGISVFTASLHGFSSLKVQDEPGLEIEKVIPQSVFEPSLETKEVHPESSLEPSEEEIDWKMIRHLWYSEPSVELEPKEADMGRGREPGVEIDWKAIRHLWYSEPSSEGKKVGSGKGKTKKDGKGKGWKKSGRRYAYSKRV